MNVDLARPSPRSLRAYVFVAVVGLFPLAINPFGVPAFGLPRLTWLRAGAALLGVLLAWELLDRREPAKRVVSTAWTALGLVVGSTLLATAFSASPVTSLLGEYNRWEGVWTLAVYWLVFAAALRWGRNRTLFSWIWPVVLGTGLVVSALGILEFFDVFRLGSSLELFCAAGFGSSSAVSSRIIATCGSAAFLGGYLAMIVPLAVALAVSPDLGKRGLRWLAGLTALFGGIALVMTYARAAWLGAAAALVVLAWLERRRRVALAWVAAGLVVALAVSSAAALVQKTWSPAERAESIVRISEGSLPQRIAIARDTLPMIRDHWLFGVGPDAYGEVFPRYESRALLATGAGGVLQNDRAHNDLLQVAATEGVVGLAAWLVFLVLLARAAGSAIGNTKDGWTRSALVGASVAMLAYVIQAQFEFSTFVVAPLFWAFAGLVWSGASRYETRPSAPPRGFRTAGKALAVAAAVASVAVAGSFWLADASYNRGIAALYARDARGAVAAYRIAVAEDPFEPLYRASLGSALVSASALDPASGPALMAEAASQFAAGRRLAPLDSTVDFMAGNAYLEFGAAKGAASLDQLSVRAYERGLRHDPLAVDALSQAGRAYAYEGRWLDALATWRRALSVAPNNANLLAFTGRAYEKLGRKTAAGQSYRAALAKDPANQLAASGLKALEASGAVSK